MRKKIFSKLVAIISVLLCFSVVFGSVMVHAEGDTQPDAIGDKVTVRFIFVNFRNKPNLSADSIVTQFWFGRNVTVLGYDGYFTHVQDNTTKEKGYIFSLFLDDDGEGLLSVNDVDFSAFEGKTRYSLIKINYSGKKNVSWELSEEGIVDVMEESDGNLTIKGISPGSVTITIKAGSESEERTLNCIYKWKKSWTAKANTSTEIMKGAGENYETWTTISSGDKFIVYGDDGSSDGWAYGNVKDTNIWGFVKINDISTKGTVSQYNNMGWSYPIKRDLFKHISSPYGWRGDYRHLGLDINRQGNTAIEGEYAVAPFNGIVVYANTSYNATTKEPDYGYCVVIEADDYKDPVSGKKLRAVYMHFLEKPMVDIEDPVIAGKTELGKVGSTGNSTGPHLHLEINNKGTNFAGSTNSDSFDKTVNPIFFYLNSGLKDDSDSTYNEYWYNDNK